MIRCVCKIVACIPNAANQLNFHIGFRMVHITQRCSNSVDNARSGSTLDHVRTKIAEDKKELKNWRESFQNPVKEWSSKFKLFGNENQTSDFICTLQQPIDLSPKAIKKWWVNRKEHIERFKQQYVEERHNILGNDLAAAHFLLYRGCSVKFVHNSEEWIRPSKELHLPNKFDPKYKIEAIRCDNMTIYYEGLENLRNLEHLKFLSFRNVAPFDDWCLDRVSGSQFSSLKALDISGTKCTANGLNCLYRIPSLTLLIVDDQKQSLEFELMCTLLEEIIPKLKVVNAETVNGVKS